MSVKLGTLTLDLVTKIGNFVGPINEAESKLTKSLSKMRDSVNKFGLIAVSAGAGAAATVIAMADTMAKQNAELERFAYLSQTSVAEFQKMSVGAKMMGIEADKLSDIMKDWNERFGDFLTTGGGPLVDFMEQVAVKTENGADGAMKLAKELSKLSGPESMGLFVKKMEEANLSQDQMSFLMESMASDATQLLPLLKNNAEGMRLWGEAAERAGIIMDEETLKASRELQVQTQMLDMQYEGLKKQLLSAVIPALVDVSEAMVDGDTSARGMADAGDVLATSLRGVAAIGIGVYATLNLIAVAMAGVTKSAVDSYNITQKAAEQGSWFDKLPGIKLLKGGLTFGVTASAENSGIGMAVEDSKTILEDSANKLEKIFDSATSTATAKLAALQGEVNQTSTAATQGAKDWLDKQNKVTDATKAATKAQSDLNKAYQDAVKLAYDYGTEYQRIEHDLTNEIKTINGSSLGASDKTKMIAEAKAISEARKKVYLLEYQQDVDAWSWSEDQKLAKHFAVEKARVMATKGMSKEERQIRLDSFESQLKQEQAWLELDRQQRLFNIEQNFLDEVDAMKERYRLERLEIEKTKDAAERSRLLNASYRAEDNDYETKRQRAWNTYQGMKANQAGIGAYFQLDQEKNTADANVSEALKYNLITDEEAKADLLKNEEEFLRARLDLNLSFGEQIAGSYADMFKNMLGEQSAAYKAMFVVEKAAAIARSTVAIQAGIALAAENPFPLNLAAMATVAAETASIISNIQSATMTVTGMAHDGIANIPEEGTWLLNKGERVLNPQDNKAFTDFINSQSSGEPNITINNNTGANVSASRGVDGRVYVTIDEVENFVSQSLRMPNSRISKSLTQNTNAGRRR